MTAQPRFRKTVNHFSFSLVVFLNLSLTRQLPCQDRIEALKDAVVRIEIRTTASSPTIPGTGFVIAANANTVTILTARHLFYTKAGEPLLAPLPIVTFYLDRRHPPRKATLLSDSPTYEFAVLEISADTLRGLDIAKLPRFSLRQSELAPICAG